MVLFAYGTAALGNAGMPVYYPRLISSGTSYDGPTAGEYPRGYLIHDQSGAAHAAYRMVLIFNANLGQFYGVHSIAVDSKGNIYTTETYQGHRVQKFVYKGAGPIVKQDQGVVWPRKAS